MAKSDKKKRTPQIDLTGQFLIAMPAMADTRFERSVVFICTHSPTGAMGIIINKRLENISFEEILLQVARDATIDAAIRSSGQVWFGGPVEQGRGLVLHSPDYKLSTSLSIGEDIQLTSSTEILIDIAAQKGPEKSLLALGYAGWGAGQLESELAQNSWLTCKASSEIMFDVEADKKYQRAMLLMGIDPALLSMEAGHA